MPPNAKFASVHITSSISDVCLQEVVGMAKNNTNYNDVRFLICNLISLNKINAKLHNSEMKTTASYADPCLNCLERLDEPHTSVFGSACN